MSELDSVRRRTIRSYVLRQGRMSTAQKRAYEGLLARYAIPYAERHLDLTEVFGRSAPTVVEIGFGMGETLAAIAQASPQTNYVGIEVHSPGVGSLLKQIDALGLTNVRIVQHDAVEVVQTMLPPDSLAGIHVFFPDPWPKKRHHKRRLIQPDFVRLLASRLAPAGLLHVATDWEDYAGHMLAVLSEESLLRNTAPGFVLRPASRPLTKFERRARQLGHGVWDLVFQRVALPQSHSQ
jgi:tRNA (guanine-N7-)-methyltransferase